MKRFLSMITIAIIASIPSFAQQLSPSTINSASGFAGAGSTLIDWNIGEVLSNTFTGANIIVTNGFLQNNPGGATAVSNQPFTSYEVKFLPNPTKNNLQYRISIQNRGKITMLLYDLNGRLLINKQIQYAGGNENGEINMSALPAAAYQLMIRFEPVSGKVKQSVYAIEKLN